MDQKSTEIDLSLCGHRREWHMIICASLKLVNRKCYFHVCSLNIAQSAARVRHVRGAELLLQHGAELAHNLVVLLLLLLEGNHRQRPLLLRRVDLTHNTHKHKNTVKTRCF